MLYTYTSTYIRRYVEYVIHISIIRTWLTYQPKLKLLKELRMKRISEEKLKLAEEFKARSKAAVIIQKYWRGYKYVQIMYM